MKTYGQEFIKELVGINDVKTLLDPNASIAKSGMSLLSLLITYFPATKAIKVYKAMEAAKLLDKGLETATDLEKVSKAAGLTAKESKAFQEMVKSEKMVGKADNISIDSRAAEHLKSVEGFSKGGGISGGHNMANFSDEISKLDGKIVSETDHSTINGIKEVQYKVPQKLPNGSIKEPIEYTSATYKKTVYDPKIISDEQMARWGEEAMKDGVIDGNTIAGVSSNGLKFVGYIRNGKITNFFPVIE